MAGKMMKPGGEQTDHQEGASSPRYASREEQLAELLAYRRRRDRRLSRAIVQVLSADARTLDAFGRVLSYVANQARNDARGSR